MSNHEAAQYAETAGTMSLNIAVDENDLLKDSIEQARSNIPELRTRIHGLLGPVPGAGYVSVYGTIPLGRYKTERGISIKGKYEPDTNEQPQKIEDLRTVYVEIEGFRLYEIGTEEAFVASEAATHPHDPVRRTSMTMVDLLHLGALLDLYESTLQENQETPIHQTPETVS